MGDVEDDDIRPFDPVEDDVFSAAASGASRWGISEEGSHEGDPDLAS